MSLRRAEFAEQCNFLSGVLGGRRYYEEKHGHMDLRRMHTHVPISRQDAEDWLFCMDRARARNGLAGPEIDRLRATFRRICLMMLVNDLAEWGCRPDGPGRPAPDPASGPASRARRVLRSRSAERKAHFGLCGGAHHCPGHVTPLRSRGSRRSARSAG
ncbi:MAG: hypothetical protein H5U18_08990 [Rhodobacteraceae bacterium]|nr:hypothetical protein [Paracoccaceae bacterium]